MTQLKISFLTYRKFIFGYLSLLYKEFFPQYQTNSQVDRLAMDLSEIILYFILPAAVIIYFYVKKKFSFFDDLGIPYKKPSFPLGNLRGMGKEFHMMDLLLKAYNECKGKDVLCGFYNSIQPIFLITDPELAKSVLVKDFNYFVNRGGFINEVIID